MGNLMATVGELNDAIETIKMECNAHGACCDCPLHMGPFCSFEINLFPYKWETIGDGENKSLNTPTE